MTRNRLVGQTIVSTFVVAALALTGTANSETYTLITGDPSLLYKYPGDADGLGLMGTGDDVKDSAVTTFNGSSPNTLGAYSFVTGAIGSSGGDPLLPGNANVIAFGAGSLTTDETVVSSGGFPLFTDISISGTNHLQGPGPGSITVTGLSGNYVPGTHTLTANTKFDFSFLGGLISDSSTVSLTGTVIATTTLNATGNNYVDTVIIPAASALGGTGVIFVDLVGNLGINLPWIPLPATIRLVAVGVAGVPIGSQADLSIRKGVDTFVQNPGGSILYTLTAKNNGTANAASVTVTDKLPADTTFLGDSCGAGPPVDRLINWNLSLNAGAAAQCNVSLNIDSGANFDFGNAAIIFSERLDPDIANNITRQVVRVRDGGSEGIVQAVDTTPPFFPPSDMECDNCASASQAMTDNFKINIGATLNQLSFCGAYSTNVVFNDNFQIKIWQDQFWTPGIDGVPGALVATLPNNTVRAATGQNISAFTVYRYDVNLNQHLPRGKYWITVVNNSAAAGGLVDWIWLIGNPDAGSRSPKGIAFNPSFVEGGPHWGPNPNAEMCFELQATGDPAEIFSDGFESGNTSAWSSVMTVAGLGLALMVGFFGWRRFRS